MADRPRRDDKPGRPGPRGQGGGPPARRGPGGPGARGPGGPGGRGPRPVDPGSVARGPSTRGSVARDRAARGGRDRDDAAWGDRPSGPDHRPQGSRPPSGPRGPRPDSPGAGPGSRPRGQGFGSGPRPGGPGQRPMDRGGRPFSPRPPFGSRPFDADRPPPGHARDVPDGPRPDEQRSRMAPGRGAWRPAPDRRFDRGDRPPGAFRPRPDPGRPPSGGPRRPPAGGPYRRDFGGPPQRDRPWSSEGREPQREWPRPALPPPDLLGPEEELVAGRRPVEEAFAAGRPAIRLLVVPQRREPLEKLVLHATRLRIPIVELEGGSLTALAGFDGHQGVALVVEPREFASLDDILARASERDEPPFVLVLDSLEDPQNVGTLLRSAEAAGIHGVVFPTRRQAPLSPSAIKASAGAVEHLLLAPGRRSRCRPRRPPRARPPDRRFRGGRAADRPPERPPRTGRDRRRKRGPGSWPGGPQALRPADADPDARRGRLAQCRRRRLDPPVRGGRPARSRGPPPDRAARRMADARSRPIAPSPAEPAEARAGARRSCRRSPAETSEPTEVPEPTDAVEPAEPAGSPEPAKAEAPPAAEPSEPPAATDDLLPGDVTPAASKPRKRRSAPKT